MSKKLLKEYIKIACGSILSESIIESSETYKLFEKMLSNINSDREKIELAKNFDMAAEIVSMGNPESIEKFSKDKEFKSIISAILKDRKSLLLPKLPSSLKMLKHYNQKISDETDRQLKSL